MKNLFKRLIRKRSKFSMGASYRVEYTFDTKSESRIIPVEWYDEVVRYLNSHGAKVSHDFTRPLRLAPGDSCVFAINGLSFDAAFAFKMRYGGVIREGELIWRASGVD